MRLLLAVSAVAALLAILAPGLPILLGLFRDLWGVKQSEASSARLILRSRTVEVASAIPRFSEASPVLQIPSETEEEDRLM